MPSKNGRNTIIAKLFVSLILWAMIGLSAQAQTFTVLYNFGSGPNDPAVQYSPEVISQGQDGNLYSASQTSLNAGLGVAYNMSTTGTLNIVATFEANGASTLPYGGLVLGTDGNYYGTTAAGGTYGSGTIFKVTPSGTVTVLYSFTGSSDGFEPFAAPVEGTDGSFYGTTTGGGTTGCGTVYKITSSGSFKSLYSFNCSDGYNPQFPLVQGSDGNFYGTTESGGISLGNVFKITPAGKLTVIYSFDGNNGYSPLCSLVQGSDGNFYGTTLEGGAYNAGTVFKISSTGHISLLHSFNPSTDGSNPNSGLALGTDGNFYGGAAANGPLGYGTLYSITPKGVYTVLYSFDSTTAGAVPSVLPVQHTNGIFYGETASGGPDQYGTFYSLDVGLAPFAKLVNSSAKEGATLEVLGQGFTGTTSVSFAGTAATKFKVVSDTYLSATVPTGALTGTVSVVTPGGTLNSSTTFRVTPVLLSFTPASGSVGTSVTITGSGLMQATKVTFGRTSATFTVNSDTMITTTVPTGAKTGKIQVTTPGGVAISKTNFTVM